MRKLAILFKEKFFLIIILFLILGAHIGVVSGEPQKGNTYIFKSSEMEKVNEGININDGKLEFGTSRNDQIWTLNGSQIQDHEKLNDVQVKQVIHQVIDQLEMRKLQLEERVQNHPNDKNAKKELKSFNDQVWADYEKLFKKDPDKK